MTYLVYPVNPAYGTLVVSADDFSFATVGYPSGVAFIDDAKDEVVAFFPEGQIVGFVEQ